MQELGQAALVALELLEQINQDTDEQINLISKMLQEFCKVHKFDYTDENTIKINDNLYQLKIDATNGLFVRNVRYINKSKEEILTLDWQIKDAIIERIPEFTLQAIKALNASLEKRKAFLEKTRQSVMREFGMLPEADSPKELQAFLEQPQLPSRLEPQESISDVQEGTEKVADNNSNTSNPISEFIQTVGVTISTENETSHNLTKFDDGIGSDPEFWGAVGENWAKSFYQWLGYSVQEQPTGMGFDFLCKGSGMKPVKPIKSEVKARTSSSPGIRLTITEWSSLMDIENKDSYELLIVIHQGQRQQPFQSVQKIIQISRVWSTLTRIFSQLKQQEKTVAEHNSQQIEPLIGLQLSSSGNSNDIILNWKRLIEFISDPNIKSYRPLSEDNFEEVR